MASNPSLGIRRGSPAPTGTFLQRQTPSAQTEDIEFAEGADDENGLGDTEADDPNIDQDDLGSMAPGMDDDDDDDDDIEDAYEEATSREGSQEGDHEAGGGNGDYDDHENARGQTHPLDAAALGLKEISNLGKFTVSSHKIGNGVDELRSDDLKQFWQSDGPQPHKLTIYFIKRVGIRDIRFYVDASEDESYTPIKIIFKSGTGENNLIEFAALSLDNPVGWQKVPVEGAGGGPDGNTLCSYVLQMQILENHQNGKDTHLRAIRIYAMDQEVGVDAAWPDSAVAEGRSRRPDRGKGGGPSEEPVGQKELEELLDQLERDLGSINWTSRDGTSGLPDWMKEPELR